MLERITKPAVAVPVLYAPAIAERLAWTLAGHLPNRDTELRNVAISWARTGMVADAFRAGSGPTAHVGALPVIVPGTAFRMLGVDTAATSLILTGLSAAVIVTTALVLNRLFAKLGTPAVARGAAILVICLLPLHLELEARSLRVYENGWAALLLALLLLAAVRLDVRGRVGMVDILGLSAVTAVIVALSPALALTAAAVLGILAVRRLGWVRRVQAMVVLAVVLTATTLPWALRNRAAVGEMIWTRDNFGLEFAVGTHAAAVAPADPQATYLARLAEIHPHGSDRAYRALQAAGGEVAYARELGDATWSWVAAHPTAATTIWARHLREFYFPPLWLWYHTADPELSMPLRMLIVDLIAALALAGLAIGLLRREWRFLYLLPPVVLLPLPYLLTQPLIRYRYVVASLLVFMAADAVAQLTSGRKRALRPVA